MRKNTKHILFIISLFLLFLWIMGYQCPLLFFFGIPCPFCGMTRAFLCVLNGAIPRSFHFHPLWPLVLFILVILGLNKMKIIHISDKVINNGAFVIGILFLLCFIIRHLTHSPIVQINFTSSFLYALKKGL